MFIALALFGCALDSGRSAGASDAGTPVSCGATELSSSAPHCGGEPSAIQPTFTCGETTLTITGFDDGLVRIVDVRTGATPATPAWAIERVPARVELSTGRGCKGHAGDDTLDLEHQNL